MSSKSADVYEKFREFFVPAPVEVYEPDTDEFREELKRLANDARIFTETQAFKDLCDELNRAIKRCIPDPHQGTDVAGALALKQSGLNDALTIVERISARKNEVGNE